MRRLGLIIVLLGGMLAPPGAGASLFGVNDGVTLESTSDAEEAETLAGIGGQVHRVTLAWRGAERSPGQWTFDRWDSIYAEDLARGIKPLFVMMLPPRWSQAGSVSCAPADICPYPPAKRHLKHWKRFVRHVATRYPRAAGLEVWNEPNLDFYWKPKPSPKAYMKLVRAADKAMRKANSKLPLLAGSLSDGPAKSGVPGMDAAQFLRGMFRHGARGRFDALSLHPYSFGVNLKPTYEALLTVEDVLIRRRFRVPIWITEIGASTADQVTEPGQAALLLRLVGALGNRPGVAAVLVHTLYTPFAGNSHEAGFGIVRMDGSPKPAYCALAAMRMRAPSQCTLFGLQTSRDPDQQDRWDAMESVAAATDQAAAYRRANRDRLTGFDMPGEDPSPQQEPGPSADPSRIGVYPLGEGDGQATLLCAASRADTSYCAMISKGRWYYGHAAGSIGAAASVTIKREGHGW